MADMMLNITPTTVTHTIYGDMEHIQVPANKPKLKNIDSWGVYSSYPVQLPRELTPNQNIWITWQDQTEPQIYWLECKNNQYSVTI